MLTTYPDCDVTRPDVPPRSRLYALEPRGLGTPLVEGLPSYVLRLAAWHQVPAALLLERELLPRLPTPLPPPGRHGHWHTFRRVLSSFTATTAQWVQVLSDLTGRTDLARLTLLPWQAVLPPATLRRHAHAWCPQCAAQWHAAEQPLYTPLLWQIAAVTHCPQHGTPLQEQCPTCGQPQPTLAWRKQLGVCRHCQAPLGPQEPRTITATASPWEAWVTAQVGMLVTHPPPQPPTRRQVMDVVQTVHAVTRTQEPAWLATHLDCRPSTLSQWCMGRTVPTLAQWVRIAALLGSGLRAVLTQSPQGHPNLAVPAISTPHPPAGRQRDKAAIQAHLVATLADPTTPPVSLRAVARHLGEHSTVLQRWFPELCHAISQRYLKHQQARRAGR